MPIIIEPEDETIVTIPADFTGDVPPNSGLRCVACAADGVFTPLTRTHARGAPPKYCDEHKKGPKRDIGEGVRSSGRATNVDKLVAGINMMYMQIGGLLSFVAPTDGMLITANAGDLGESWRSLLESDAKVRAMWTKMLTGGGWSTVIIAHAMVAYPIAQAHGLIPKPKHLKTVS